MECHTGNQPHTLSSHFGRYCYEFPVRMLSNILAPATIGIPQRRGREYPLCCMHGRRGKACMQKRHCYYTVHKNMQMVDQ